MPVDMKRIPWQRQVRIIGFILLISLFLCGAWSASHAIRAFILSQVDEDIQCEWSGVKRIVAVGDLHGAYKYFKQILEGTGLVDKAGHWKGGKTHLVQIGDVLDRGDGAKDIFDLIKHLEKEAEAAGGRVHMLIGNHEEMNLANTAFDRKGYITVEQFRSFLPENYVLSQEKRFSRRTGIYPSANDSNKPDFSEHWDEIITKGIGNSNYAPRKQYYKNFIDLYGQWLLNKNVIIKINDIVFVHGGISETFSKRGLKEINTQFRIEMDDLITAIIKVQMPKIPEYDREIYNNSNGPLWYRELATQVSEDFEDDVIRILGNLEAGHIVIAHTPLTAVGEENMKRFGGRVWIIDTGIADYYRPIGGHVSALIYEDGDFKVWYPEPETYDTGVEEIGPPSPLKYFFFRLHPVFPSLKTVYLQPENYKGGQ
jgi:hypothetical protein